MYQRRWADLSLEQPVVVTPKTYGVNDPQITSLVLIADFGLKK
jgi:hypothetical protein